MSRGVNPQETERRAEAVTLRKAGYTFETIGAHMGISRQRAHVLVQSALKATLREASDELRTLETERMDAMLHAIWPAIEAGNSRAIESGLRIMERRAKLLGLDAPVRTEVETNATVSASIFSHEAVTSAIARGSSEYRLPSGADEDSSDGPEMG